uniref:Uncharacterized protein n=1 Tax=Nelumbo nucifera TaxID=4432 RepID=A0A822XGN6_NELNU|nr:TPA_asm: hypothetical protein HUJ06_019734 [Nelumbo nucifera]
MQHREEVPFRHIDKGVETLETLPFRHNLLFFFFFTQPHTQLLACDCCASF